MELPTLLANATHILHWLTWTAGADVEGNGLRMFLESTSFLRQSSMIVGCCVSLQMSCFWQQIQWILVIQYQYESRTLFHGRCSWLSFDLDDSEGNVSMH